MSVIIRDATAGDARSIGEVRVASWRWAYRGQLPDEILDGLSAAEDEARLTAWFQNPEARAAILVACGEDGRILGFANAGPSRDEGATPETGELRAIYVLKDVQGSGVGLALLDPALDRLRAVDFERATLWVLESNDLGRRFYEKAGWVWDSSISTHQIECANLPIVRYARDL